MFSRLFLVRMMIEHEWLTTAKYHHPSLKSQLFPCLHIVIVSTSAEIGPFCTWKTILVRE